MPVPRALESAPAIVGPLGGLLLSVVRGGSPILLLRAVRWWRDLARLGVHVPLFAVHDLGLLYAAPRERFELKARSGIPEAVAGAKLSELVASYRALVLEVAESQAASAARGMKLSDDLVAVVLARILAPVVRDGGSVAPWPATLPLDPELVRDLDGQLATMFTALPRAYEAQFLTGITRSRLRVLTLVDGASTDTLRLLGMLSGHTAIGALAHVDLLAALSNPIADEIVSFSLELLPSVLEARRRRAPGTHPSRGFGGVGRQGSMDSMVLTELAWDSRELLRRMLEGELLFYSREQAPQEPRRLHHVVIDGSASMRGEREVFARGLAIALGKKLQLAGDDVWMRFFDSRLYDVPRPAGRASLPAAWVLGFKGERGRNPARVFSQLAAEAALLRARDPRDLVIHVITHAALHVPRNLVQEVRQSGARLFAVFILPSGGTLDLRWLDLLDGYAVVDHATLHQRDARAMAATEALHRASSGDRDYDRAATGGASAPAPDKAIPARRRRRA